MGLTAQQRSNIASLLKEQIGRKLDAYSPESAGMPFHIRLLGKDRIALFSFIQSVNTMLGTSVFEQVAVLVAQPRFQRAIRQYKDFNDSMSEEAQTVIQQILDDLRTKRAKPSKPTEIARILEVAQREPFKKVKRPRIDLFLESSEGTEYYFDVKTAKPNLGEILGFKRTLLEWVAIRGAINPTPNVYTGLAIPYNPYEPEPYDRWTFKGLMDVPEEVKVAEEFWDFLGGKNTYEELLEIFEEVGIELRPRIDEKFRSFPSTG